MTELLRVGHGNGHNRPELVEFIAQARADSFGGNETQRLRQRLNRLSGHRVISAGEDLAEERDRGRSTCVVTSSRRENIGELSRKVSERVPGFERIAPDRHLVVSMYAHPLATRLGFEGVAHAELHPDATVMRHDDPHHPIVREYRQALVSTRRWLHAARGDGLLIVLTGDLQATARYSAPWGPRALLIDELDLNPRVVGIDWIGIDRRLRYVGPLETRRLYDHTAFVANLGPNRK